MMKNKNAAPPESAQQPGETAFQPHANNNAESDNKQGYGQTLRRWIKAFIGILYCRNLIPFSVACWTIRKIGGCHD
jgi:hypothetical protein